MGTQEHNISRNTGGHMYESWIQPVCSCGWQGRREYAHNDYQHSNVREQEKGHLDIVDKL